MRVKFTFDKMVSYWNSEKGMNVKLDGTSDNSHWYTDVRYLDKTIDINSLEDVQPALERLLEKNGLPFDYFAIMEDGRVSFNAIEDGNADIVEDESDAESRGKQLFICDYNVYIEIQQVYEPSVKQLQSMFPKSEY